MARKNKSNTAMKWKIATKETLLWGQCMETMKNEPQAEAKFEDMDDDQDPMQLMKNMKKITTNFRDKKCAFGSMWHAWKQLNNCV